MPLLSSPFSGENKTKKMMEWKCTATWSNTILKNFTSFDWGMSRIIMHACKIQEEIPHSQKITAISLSRGKSPKCAMTVFKVMIFHNRLFVVVVLMRANEWEANVFCMLSHISHITFNKYALYHNILKNVLELRFHWERHVFANEASIFKKNHHTTRAPNTFSGRRQCCQQTTC